MRIISLQSGSNGNCVYVEAGGARLLFDAGISGVQVEKRLALHGRDVTSVEAVLISHDHVDHSRSMGICNRKFGLPIHVTPKTYRAAHDGVDGVVFVVDDGIHRLGVLTDLGHVFGELEAVIGSLDGLHLNHFADWLPFTSWR